MDMIRGTLAKFDVSFDVWQSERALHDSGEVSEHFGCAGSSRLHRPARQRRVVEDHGAVG